MDQYFEASERPKQGGLRLYVKATLILAFFAASYLLLVFGAQNWWQGFGLVIVLGVMTALIGFNIQHDGGHRAFSPYPWVNRVAAMTLDLVGGSSYLWHWKHTVIHHRYVNITWFDNDINLGALARVSPHHQRLWYYRWQHFYLWPLYGLEALKVQLVDNFKYLIRARVGHHRIPRPSGWELVLFIVGRIIFFGWVFVIPIFFHPWWVVLFYYGVGESVLGVLIVLIFVLPHLVEEADFPLAQPATGRMAMPWAVHQAQSTLDFARHNRVLTWVLGGLNYHKEHHLFPSICHINYPALSKLVEETCRDFAIPYKEHKSFRAGIVAHYFWLKRMGAAN